jgi:acetyl esterase/lipase
MASRRLSLASIAILTLLYGCSPVAVLNQLTPSGTYLRTPDVAYGPDPHMRLDVYRPSSLPADAPVVVFFYGGSWSSGGREEYLFVGEALASRGIVTVIADYRLYPEVRYPEFLKDCAAAVAWTFQHVAQYGGNPDRIFVAGHSAGAYNAAMVALDPRWLAPWNLKPSQLAGFVGLAGPYNFLPIVDEDIKPIFGAPNTPLDSQPIAHVTGPAPRTLLLVARSDRFVFPDRNTEVLAARLREQGDPVTVRSYGGVSHTTLIGSMARPLRVLAPVLDDFSSFVLAH